MIKLGVIGYVPPLKYGNGVSKVFLENLRAFPTKNQSILFTDPGAHDGLVNLKVDADVMKNLPTKDGRANEWSLNNALFITAVRMAIDNGWSHMLYLESDCRVNQKHWDAIVFEEFFSAPVPAVAGGSVVCWNPHAGGFESLQRWQDLIQRNNKARNFPIPTYGHGASGTGPTAIFPNGALGVYDLVWMKRFFDIHNAMDFAARHAWDFVIGEEIWHRFGIDSFDMVTHLNTIFSSYGEIVSTEAQRLAMLRRHDVVAIHQVKSHETFH
jgi:hypothetical protein